MRVLTFSLLISLSFFVSSLWAGTEICVVEPNKLARLFDSESGELAEIPYPVDPKYFANFSRTSRKQFLRQMKIARSLVGKRVKQFEFTAGQTYEIEITGVSSSLGEFRQTGISLRIAEVKPDGKVGSVHSSAPLRKVLIHAKTIQDWISPVKLPAGRMPRYRLPASVDSLTARNGLGRAVSPVGETTYYELPKSVTQIKITSALSELSNETRLTFEKRGSFRVKQLGILTRPAPSDFEMILQIAEKTGGEIRIVDATRLTTGKRISKFAITGTDVNGKPLLLISKDYLALSRITRADEIGQATGRMYDSLLDDWMQPAAKRWIEKRQGEFKALDQVLWADYDGTMESLVRTSQKGAPMKTAVEESLSAATKARLTANGETLESISRLKATSEDDILNSMTESFEEKGGRVELVNWVKHSTGEVIPRPNGAFVRGSKGEPVLLVTPDTILKYAMADWAEYLRTLSP